MLVGRTEELARIAAVVDAARAGGSAALLVLGHPGLGKSSLLEAALAEVGGDVLVLRARGVEREEHAPFAGLEELLSPVLGLREQLPPAQATALAQSLALEPGTPAARFAVGAAVVTLLGVAAEERPVLCVVDDLQWLDEPSLETILFAARRLRAEGVGIVLASRLDTAAARAAGGIPALDLVPLGEAAARRLLDERSDGAVLADEVAERIVATAAGNPLALVEIPGLLSEAERSGREPLATPLPVGATVERVVDERLAGLPADTRRALAIAAAGEIRRGDIVVAALRGSGLDLPALEPAETTGIVQLDRGEVVFRHPLLRAAAYHAVTPAERRAAHAAIAAVLDSGDPQRAWQHAAAADGPDEAVAAELEQAAYAALGRGGLGPAAEAQLRAATLSPEPADRARRLLGAAVALLGSGQLDRAAEHLDAAAAIEDGAEAMAGALNTARGHVALRRGASAQARALLEPQAAHAEHDDPAGAAALWLLVSLAATTGRDADGALSAAERARTIAASIATGDPTLETLATALAGSAHLAAGHLDEGRDLLVRAEPGLAAMDPVGPASELVTIAAHAFVWIDDFDRAERTLGRIVERAREASAVGALPYPLAALAQLELSRGRWRAAQALSDEAVALGEQAGQDAALVIALSTRAWSAANRGDATTARSDADRAFALAQTGGTLALTLYARWGVALLDLAQGRPADAAVQLEAAREQALPGHLTWAPELVEAYLAAGRRADAEALAPLVHPASGVSPAIAARTRALLAGDDKLDAAFGEAERLHDAESAPFETARTRLLFGERLRAAGRDGDAREPLGAALAAFDDLGARPWSARARGALQAAGGVLPQPTGPVTGELTPHELQVALLVAEGRTNKETAAALFLSPKTVEHHLGSIYRKLGVKRRTELSRLFAGELPAPAGV